MDYLSLYQETIKKVGFADADPIPYIVSTGSYTLDQATGIGGYAGGRMYEIYGLESSGKTTLGVHALKEAQKLGMSVGFIDKECGFDEQYHGSLIGGKNKDFIYAVPETGEQTFETIEHWLEKDIKVILVDSVSAMTPKAEIEGNYGEAFMGLHARLMSQGCRKLVSLVRSKNAIVIFINQIRMKIGVMFGSPETTTGGKALQFYSAMRFEVRQNGDEIKSGSSVMGRYSTVKVKKNKLSLPGRTAEIPILFGVGIFREAELFGKLVAECKIIRKGSNYYLDDVLIGTGKEKAISWLVEYKDGN